MASSMHQAGLIAASFTNALADDFYPTADIERLFGIQMHTPLGQLVLGAWVTLYKHDGFVATETLSEALRTDTLPEAFNAWIRESRGSGYTEQLIVSGTHNIPWMRMVELRND
jgi:hypothetical protein